MCRIRSRGGDQHGQFRHVHIQCKCPATGTNSREYQLRGRPWQLPEETAARLCLDREFQRRALEALRLVISGCEIWRACIFWVLDRLVVPHQKRQE